MNSRERLIAAARGGEVDRKPVICWPKPCPESDAIVCQVNPTQISLSPVVNPFGQALRSRIEVWDVLAEEPKRGEKILDELVGKTRSEIKAAFEHGADGVIYLLYGARGLHATPMEYGGHYLERDRELLTEIEDAPFNLIFVVGEDDAYLDFVSDLPAQAFGWDAQATGAPPSQLREMRSGALAANAPDADIELRFGASNLIADLELELQTTHV
ncbi:MAG TPA: hypothetical protein VHE55_06630 [Fimbriimonadaceae bacterium]|nr:hypothetical protein [Fimbriimonadaceae bacterium]